MIPDTLDTTNTPPSMGSMGGHPCGMHDFTITNTYLKENSQKTGAFLTIELTSPVGRIEHRFNLFNPSAQAVEIANKELSALTHAIGKYQVNFPKNADGSPNFEMAGSSLRGGRGRMDIGFQKGQEPTAEKPQGGYVEVKKFFDVAGNEPGKPASAPQTQPQQNAQWGAPPAAAAPQAAAPAAQWGNAPAAQQLAQAPAAAPAAWSNGPANPAAGGAPPWAK